VPACEPTFRALTTTRVERSSERAETVVVVIAISIVTVTVVGSLVIGLLLTGSAFGSVTLAKMVHRYLEQGDWAQWARWAGVLIAIAGVVDLTWTQLSTIGDLGPGSESAAVRWAAATEPLILVALGLLVVICAQVLAVIQTLHSHGEKAAVGATRIRDSQRHT
jgi:hypothetical protein